MLDVQVNILSVDTGNFYSNREAHLHWLNHKLRVERNNLKKRENEIVKTLLENGEFLDGNLIGSLFFVSKDNEKERFKS